MLRFLIILLLIVNLTACASRTDSAPVSDINTIEKLPKNGTYRVTTNETLYSIAWRYGLDYRDIAQRNQLTPPFHIQKGQLLYLTRSAPVKKSTALIKMQQPNAPMASSSQKKKLSPSRTIILKAPAREPSAVISFWRWPAYGPVVSSFSSGSKGINIHGIAGSPIFATAAGKVVYSGHGLRGYGNLIIIKHNSKFLSAYAHNRKILVKEGDWVKNGQKIAEMGNTGIRDTQLHFEIRRNGRPVNPLMYLTRKV